MAIEPTTGLTYDDLLAFPEDNTRRELIDGELIVAPSPIPWHQKVVATLTGRLLTYAEQHGGEVFPGPLDVYVTERNVLEPDVLFVRAENVDKAQDRPLHIAPDLVVEVSSPSTRRLDLTRKKELYEQLGVPEYWYVDLEAERVEAYRLAQARYGRPFLFEMGDAVEAASLPGFSVAVRELLRKPGDR